MIEFGAFLLSPSPAHIRGGGAASSYIWIVGLPIIEMVTTRVWERLRAPGGGHARGGARGHREATELCPHNKWLRGDHWPLHHHLLLGKVATITGGGHSHTLTSTHLAPCSYQVVLGPLGDQ